MQNKDFEIPIYQKLTLTKEEAAAYSHVGINKIEEQKHKEIDLIADALKVI